MNHKIYHPQIFALRLRFEAHASVNKSAAMASYMKDRFPFHGLQKPLRSELQKDFLSEVKLASVEITFELARELWEQPEREYQYVAMEMLMGIKRKWNEESLRLFEELILTKSWWDTVDHLASRMVGGYCLKDHERHAGKMMDYAESDNSWLNRTALIHQLFYREKTDVELFEAVFLKCHHKKEFFIQKAIGWALRQYGATDPGYVLEFTRRHALSPLAKREALRKLII
jgi:3-methyladenine DNA glycosylase AlkD